MELDLNSKIVIKNLLLKLQSLYIEEKKEEKIIIDYERLAFLFPPLKNKQDIYKLLIDNDSIHYITPYYYSNLICELIYKITRSYDKIITETNGGVGGDTLNFANKFKFVNTVELDPKRCDYLDNNLKIYDLRDKVEIYNNDALNVIYTIENQDIVFMDPPWGGSDYKKYNKISLSIGAKTIETITNELFDDSITKCPPELIVLKLPINYDINNFKKLVNHPIKIFSYKKMLIFTIIK